MEKDRYKSRPGLKMDRMVEGVRKEGKPECDRGGDGGGGER